ncbi:helix-turn-helix domain-containing protein [Undibacterium sp. Jales W-56]|uniref:helix-turn-helix domain-containing protein n=1 Tax=Undibacterium sp. Jales W-56 TaxID=2897325 RepID=UPI0021CF0F4B|nr:helix-turn-helix domain-containing protein [Undibacterium sp. Jales W-56]MCU6432791.1 helix-turn-helix domain-containing protein [Undibacterium sp. Jales W-56]
MSDPVSGEPVLFEATGSFQYQELIESRLGQPIAPELSVADAERLAKSPGAKLLAARNALGWSVEQVASQLRLAPRQIRSLEADDYAGLPEPAVIKGFVRAYAKLLKLDPAPVIALLTADLSQTAMDAATSRDAKSMRTAAKPDDAKTRAKSFKLLLSVAAIGLLALLWLVFKPLKG